MLGFHSRLLRPSWRNSHFSISSTALGNWGIFSGAQGMTPDSCSVLDLSPGLLNMTGLDQEGLLGWRISLSWLRAPQGLCLTQILGAQGWDDSREAQRAGAVLSQYSTLHLHPKQAGMDTLVQPVATATFPRSDQALPHGEVLHGWGGISSRLFPSGLRSSISGHWTHG